MKSSTKDILKNLTQRYPQLSVVETEIEKVYNILEDEYRNNKKVLICGNGGSASDSEHMVGELLKSFTKPRKIDCDIYEKLSQFGEEGKKLQNTLEGSLRAISLTSHIALSTAFSNDKEPTVTFAQQLYGLAEPFARQIGKLLSFSYHFWRIRQKKQNAGPPDCAIFFPVIRRFLS